MTASVAAQPGDDLIPTPDMLYNQHIAISAPPPLVFPWLMQLGKARAGWYAPSSLECFLPASWRAIRHINQDYQTLSIGDRIPDYGFSAHDEFEVMHLEQDRAIVYRSQRYGCEFTWALLLHDVDGGRREEGKYLAPGEGERTDVHLRFRGRIRSRGWKRTVIVWAGERIDRWTTRPMLKGLKERCEARHADSDKPGVSVRG